MQFHCDKCGFNPKGGFCEKLGRFVENGLVKLSMSQVCGETLTVEEAETIEKWNLHLKLTTKKD
jgi:hypothetical protein